MKKIANIVLNDFTNDSRVWKISKSFANLGYKPTVVAMHNTGLKTVESIEGVEIERIELITRPWPKWKPIQILKYLEFLFRAFWRYRKVDLVHCNDLNAFPVALLIKIFGHNVKIIYDCHEYETEINGLVGLEKKGKEFLERFLIRFADQVITVSDSIANEYARLYGIPKPNLLLNCPAFIEIPKNDLFRESLGIRSDQVIFLYQGALIGGRGVEMLLKAFDDIDSDKNVLLFMGYGSLEHLIKKKSKANKNIFFHQAVSPDVLLDYTSSADFGVSFIEDTCLSYRYCLPNKVFEYLMAGLPVITSNLVEMKFLVETEGVGVVAKNNTVDGFRCAVKASLELDYSATRDNVIKARKKYCWEKQEKVLKEIYDAL